ncbi:restriction endonuclease subunit S [Clostridium perfringens]|nr:restriction endonuclease subunit S [Clostridium perfringens]
MKKEAREGYKMTELGEIPNEWQIKNLEDISYLIDGDRSSRYPGEKDIVEHGILFLSTQNIIDSKIVYKNCKFITEEKFDELSKGKLQKNDLIITLRGSIGNVAKFNGDIYETGFINAQIMIIRSNDINPTYLSKYLISVKSQKQITSISSGSAQPQLTKSELKKLKVIVPSEYEQKKIVEILSTVDEQIENTEKLIQKNQELKKGLMQQLLTKGIGHTEFKKTELGEIPDEWEIIKLKECFEVFGGYAFRSNNFLTEYKNETYQVLRMGNVQLGYLDTNKNPVFLDKNLISKKEKRYLLKKSDILISLTGTINKTDYGNVSWVDKDDMYLLNQRVACLRKNNKNYNNRYYYYFLQSNLFRKQFFECGVGGTGNQANVSTSDINDIRVFKIAFEEQINIASILSKIDEKIEEYKNKSKKLELIKKGLMQQLLTGKIRALV